MSTHKKLFLELAKPDKNGVSRWVSKNEFIGKYSILITNNGQSWSRGSSALAKEFIIEKNRQKTPGNSVDEVRLNGYNTSMHFNQHIRLNIKKHHQSQNCVMLGINGKSENTTIEVDHKNGRKDDDRISNLKTQELSDFQPLSKAANDIKRQICKICKKTDKRWNAKNLMGNPFEFYYGDKDYTKEVGCVGCYQYDPVEYRKTVVIKVGKMASKEATDIVFRKLYPED